jgi:uncharacterized protein YegL
LTEAPLIPDVSLKKNKAERLPCVVVVDGSLSMKDSGAISELNEGLKILERELKDDDDACDAVRIALLRMGDSDEVEVLYNFTDAAEFSAPIIRANGSTPLGKAVDLAMHMIEEEKLRLRQEGITYKRPWLFIMSDGEPTDEFNEVAARAREAQGAKKFVLWAIGTGTEAPLAQLSEFCVQDRPPARLGKKKFKEMFVWLSDSAKAGSKLPTGQQMAMPSPKGWMETTL